jgi:hypothetical protein
MRFSLFAGYAGAIAGAPARGAALSSDPPGREVAGAVLPRQQPGNGSRARLRCMSVKEVWICDGCGKECGFTSNHLEEPPKGWLAFQVQNLRGHVCHAECAPKAIQKLLSPTGAS